MKAAPPFVFFAAFFGCAVFLTGGTEVVVEGRSKSESSLAAGGAGVVDGAGVALCCCRSAKVTAWCAFFLWCAGGGSVDGAAVTGVATGSAPCPGSSSGNASCVVVVAGGGALEVVAATCFAFSATAWILPHVILFLVVVVYCSGCGVVTVAAASTTGSASGAGACVVKVGAFLEGFGATATATVAVGCVVVTFTALAGGAGVSGAFGASCAAGVAATSLGTPRRAGKTRVSSLSCTRFSALQMLCKSDKYADSSSKAELSTSKLR
mmetsp:Transcript_88669/g.156976  ORF Transcript_88669/g.156976 Transcript_88669/m.156976 type:complete len:266 (-) Transcript_88669:707-1504(-)